MYDFKDQAILIVGGTGNLGQAVARAFHSAGVNNAAISIYGCS